MGKVVLDITISLDGFIAGPNDELERLHEWIFLDEMPASDVAVVDEHFQALGAVIMGRGTFEDGVKKQGWAGWVDTPPFDVPIFVLSHDVPDKLARGKTAFTFITDGIESALREAKAAAGNKNVTVMGGAITIQQYLKAGLVDEIQIHVAPLLLGVGKRLFENIGAEIAELEQLRVVVSPRMTHLQYRVIK